MLLGEFAKLRKEIIRFVMPVRLSVCLSVCLSVRSSVRIEQLGFQWTDFHEILHLSIFRKSVEKIRVPLKWNKSNGYFT
jgi:hypothetical protein